MGDEEMFPARLFTQIPKSSAVTHFRAELFLLGCRWLGVLGREGYLNDRRVVLSTIIRARFLTAKSFGIISGQ